MKKVFLSALCIGLAACGQSITVGGGPSSNPGVSYQTVSGTNVMPITVDGSLCNSSTMYMNEPCATVTICASAGSPCQSISNILVDTGSFGLRIFSSVINSSVKSGLNQTGAGNVAECAHFGSGTTFGPVVSAYVQLGGEETSTAIPIQLIDDLYPTESSKAVSAALCTGPGPKNLAPDDNPTSSQYNGILGIGLLNQDCGSSASTGCTVANSTPPPDYFSCTGVTCTSTTTLACTSQWGSVGCGTNIAIGNQVSNPVFAFPTDNDGLVVLLPPLNSSGNLYANGYVVFGIGTGTNGNNSPSASVNVFSANTKPYFTSSVKLGLTGNTNYTASFLDSGSNAIYLDPAVSITPCPCGSSTFYTQSGISTETVTINGISTNFFISNANTLFSTANYVFNDVGGPFSSGTVDLGIPFFYGRAVWLGLNGQPTSGTPIGSQTGPFWAY